MPGSKRLAKERERSGISARDHYCRTRTAELQRRAAPREKKGVNVEARVSSGGAYNQNKGANRKGDTAMNRGAKRRGLTGTKTHSMFQGAESRGRDSDLASMVSVNATDPDLFSSASGTSNGGSGSGSGGEGSTQPPPKVSVRAMGVTSWGDEDNSHNEYSSVGMKWEDAPLAASLNIVTGKRLLFDAVGAGCFALERYDPPSEEPVAPRQSNRPSSRQGSPGSEKKRGRRKARDSKGAGEGKEEEEQEEKEEQEEEEEQGKAARPSERAHCDFWRLNPIDYMALIDTMYGQSQSQSQGLN